MTEVILQRFFTHALSNAAYRMPLGGPGAELEGAIKIPLQQVAENLEPQQRAG